MKFKNLFHYLGFLYKKLRTSTNLEIFNDTIKESKQAKKK